jgi:hypothetical protein
MADERLPWRPRVRGRDIFKLSPPLQVVSPRTQLALALGDPLQLSGPSHGLFLGVEPPREAHIAIEENLRFDAVRATMVLKHARHK